MKTAACAQDAALVRELLQEVDQATTAVGERIRKVALDLAALVPKQGEPHTWPVHELALRLQGDAARLLAMGRSRASLAIPVREPGAAPEAVTVAVHVGGEKLDEIVLNRTREELAVTERAPAEPVAGDPRPGVPVMSHESLGLRKPKGGSDAE